MNKLYLVYSNGTIELKNGIDFEEFWLYIYYKRSKIYKCQFDDLMLLECNVVVITEDKSKIKYWQNEIKEFYEKFPLRT